MEERGDEGGVNVEPLKRGVTGRSCARNLGGASHASNRGVYSCTRKRGCRTHLEIGCLDQLRALEALPNAHVLRGSEGKGALQLEHLRGTRLVR